jgi:hypothetical protein
MNIAASQHALSEVALLFFFGKIFGGIYDRGN